jgi:hypothetical protein
MSESFSRRPGHPALSVEHQVVPDGVDIITVSLSIQRLTDDNMQEAIQGMERAARVHGQQRH